MKGCYWRGFVDGVEKRKRYRFDIPDARTDDLRSVMLTTFMDENNIE
jgi:hypothetical protein